MIYIFVFLISTFLIFIGEKLYDANRSSSYFFMFVAVLIPSILAGCRNESVGTDTGSYIYYFDVISKETSLRGALTNEYLLRVGIEKGYVILNYMVAQITNNAHFMLGVLALLTNLSILIGARNYKDRYPTWLIMLIYYFVFACVTFNIARQGLANGIVFAGIILLERKKYVKYFFVVLLASLFHYTSAISGIILFIVYIYIEKKQSIWRCVSIILIVAIGMNFYRIPMNLLLNIFPTYAQYALKYGNNEATVSLISIALKIPCIIVGAMYFRQANRGNSKYYIYYTLIWLDLVLSQFGAFLGPLARISYLFAYYKLLLVPEIYRSYHRELKDTTNTNSKIFLILTLIWVLIYWYVFAVRNMYGYGHPVYPYTSDILNI